MKAIERIYQYLEYKGLKPTVFEKEIGLSSGYLSVQKKRNADIGETIVNKINDNCHDINITWLLTGEGGMLKTKNEENVTNLKGNIKGNINGNKPNVQKKLPFESDILSIAEPHSEYGKVMRKLKFAEGISISDDGAPFYDLPVSAGKVHELIDLQENPTGYISLPGISCDAYFPITGASFEPYIRAGDIIGINFIDKWENLDPDCIYLIITYDQRMLKRLMAHPKDSTLLICISPNLKEFNIDKYTIRYIHKVTFCGRPV
jgi:hypothetical protein